MSLTITQNPIPSAQAYEIFAGFQPIEFKFKREDLAITSVESGSGGVKINVTTNLTAYLLPGDQIYLYSPGLQYTYDAVGTILSITATDITIDLPFIEAGSGGYINYRKNYFVEMMLVDKNFSEANKLPFVLQSDGDAAGNISIDVSVINDLNGSRGAIADGILNGVQQFEVKYREVYAGSANSYTLIDNKLFVVIYALEQPEKDVILNQFDLPKLYLGYPAGVVIAHAGSGGTTTLKMDYEELDINKELVDSGALSDLDGNLNGLHMWEWPPVGKDLFKADFTKWVPSGNIRYPYYPDGLWVNGTKTYISQEGSKLRIGTTGDPSLFRTLVIDIAGTTGGTGGPFTYVIDVDQIVGTPQEFNLVVAKVNGTHQTVVQTVPIVQGVNTLEVDFRDCSYGYVTITFRSDLENASALIGSYIIKTETSEGVALNEQTEYINFKLGQVGIYDFKSPDFASPDFVTQ